MCSPKWCDMHLRSANHFWFQPDDRVLYFDISSKVGTDQSVATQHPHKEGCSCSPPDTKHMASLSRHPTQMGVLAQVI